PKGDIGNLAFKSATFNFSKWSGKEADALKIEREKYAASLQKNYRDKATEFKVAPDSSEKFTSTAVRIFTPKSSAGLAVGISPDLSAPTDFNSLLSNDISSAADLLDLTSFNLLRLAGYSEGDRKEITFVSAILENAWKAGESLTVSDLIRNIESPSFSSVGSLPVSKVVSERERKELATKINLLLSDPKLRSWSSADSIDFSQLFGSPSINVLDLRNIQSENEKHLFVELILQRLFQWLIKQGSAQTLRYLLYFDEIAGYCPPVREPPSKKLLLLLIKQARAFGLGMLLASQNAVDLDYKVISNANVRFIGRLGAQRDIQRVSVGLELDSDAEREIARLRPGEFYCNIFDPKFKSVIKSRWTLSYHRGPLENSEVAALMEPLKKIERAPVMPRAEAVFEVEDEQEKPIEPLPVPVRDDSIVLAEGKDETFLLMEKRFEPRDLASFIRLGSN
ncbi:MAG: ATP-binding protein, partial [Nitrososphaera sp.]